MAFDDLMDQIHLHAVGILELVDHHLREHALDFFKNLRIFFKQNERLNQKTFKVDDT
ncbi:hypothetical protein D3C87_1680320 [compost metagenome]